MALLVFSHVKKGDTFIHKHLRYLKTGSVYEANNCICLDTLNIEYLGPSEIVEIDGDFDNHFK